MIASCGVVLVRSPYPRICLSGVIALCVDRSIAGASVVRAVAIAKRQTRPRRSLLQKVAGVIRIQKIVNCCRGPSKSIRCRLRISRPTISRSPIVSLEQPYT
jgi:hypothetical protein